MRLLSGPAGAVGEWAELLVGRFSGIGRRWWASGGVLVDELLTQPPEPRPGEETPIPEFDDGLVGNWWEPYWDLADTIVEGVRTHCRLSDLLAQVRDTIACLEDGGALDERMAVSALCHVAHEHFGESLKAGDSPREVVIAVPTGLALDDPVLDGEDLLLVRAGIDGHLVRETTSSDRPVENTTKD